MGAGDVFAGTPVRFAYLFGSRATGTAGPGSDSDVAVHLGGEPGGLTLILGLGRRLERLTRTRTDVVVLDDAPLRLVERVLREGRVVYCVDDPLRVTYEATMRRVCADFAIHADRLDRALIRATAEGRR